MRFVLITLLAAVCQAQGNWSYLTYLGGIGSESIRAVSSDGAGGTFVAGESYSIGPPFSAQDPGYRSVPYVFVARIDAAGQMVFAKLLGDGSASALAVDPDGNAFVSGTIRVAPDFSTPGVFQPEAVSSQAFVAKISPSGDKLFATYFGSQNGVQIRTLTLAADGRPIFCGSAIGESVPLTPSSLFQLEGRNNAAFCAQLSSDGTRLVFSTLLGKPSAVPGSNTTPTSAVLDLEGNLVVAGSTYDSEFGLAVAPQSEDRRRSLYRSRRGEPYQSLGGFRFGSVASIQSVGNEVFVGTEINGAWVSSDGGDTWRQIRGAPSGALVAHPLATRFLCVYYLNQGVCSRDGGSTWQPLGLFSGQVTLVPDPRMEGAFFITNSQRFGRFGYLALGAPAPPTNLESIPQSLSINAAGDRILAVVSNSLLLSEDRGATFRKLSDNVSRAAEAPGAPHRLYAARSVRFPARDSLMVRSDDGGVTWTDTTLNEPFTFLRQLIVDPSDPNIVYVVAGAEAYRSIDGGASWHLWTPPGLENAGVQTIHFDDRDRAWVGTLQGGNGFLIKLKIDTPAILWGTMLGGAGGGHIDNVRVDADGRIFFTGFTFGTDLPVTGRDLAPRRRGGAGFAGVFERTGELGKLRHIGLQTAGFDLSADGSMHLAATAVAADLGEVEDMRGRFAGGASDAVWLVLSPDLDRVVRATWLGGDGADTAGAIVAGRDGRVRLVGSTLSRNLPVTQDALQREFTLYGGELLIGGEGFFAIAPQ
ncbi:MAG: hypothetical protein HYX27_05980 [Acidobacteria bacterium]|nr:hypothetical protein [Acidobacteriota bacterium]